MWCTQILKKLPFPLNHKEIESKILEEFNLKSFVKINEDQIRIVVSKDEHDEALANDIMRSVQSKFDKKMYISVKFQK